LQTGALSNPPDIIFSMSSFHEGDVSGVMSSYAGPDDQSGVFMIPDLRIVVGKNHRKIS